VVAIKLLYGAGIIAQAHVNAMQVRVIVITMLTAILVIVPRMLGLIMGRIL
jgi:hypothetical protein